MKKITSSLLLVMVIISMISAQSITSSSRADKPAKVPYNSTVTPDKEITGSIICTTPAYIPGITQTLNFTLTAASPDAEYIDGVSITFPAGMTPQTAGTSNPLAANNSGGGTGNMNLAPISGQTVSWGNLGVGSQYGPITPGTYLFQVSVLMSPSLTGSQSINYFINGDGYGAAPHTITSSFTLNAAVTADVGVTSILLATTYLPGTTVTPSAVVQNFGTAAQSFTVDITLNDGTTNVYTNTYSVTNLAAGTSQTVTFPNWTAVLGTYTATVTATLAGDANPANNTLTKPFSVFNVNPAMTGNTTDLVYQSISLADGSTSNVGTIASTPFPMAETYDGTNIYRIYNDGSFGTVAPATGVFTQLGIAAGVAGTPSGIAWNSVTSTMYVMVLNTANLPQLCTMNMSDYSLTLIGTGTEGMIIGIDFADDGFIYGPSLNPDNLYKINPANGSVTSVGAVGIDLNYGQDVSFDKASQKLYSVTCGAAYKFGYYNLTTGAFVEIADKTGKQHATFVVLNPSGPAQDDDVMVESITPIPSGCGLSATQTIEITVKNVGNVSQSNIPVFFTINSGTPVNETIAGPLSAGASINYTFTTPANFSLPGTYTIEACTDLTGDMNTANDCKTLNVTNTAPSSIPYTMGFETTEDYSNWKIQNLNGDGSTWIFDEFADLAHSGTWFAIYEYNATMNADDWLISTCITLDAGVTYDLSFWYIVGEFGGTIYPEKMKVAYGTAPTSTALTNVIVDLPNMDNITYQQNISQFTVPTTGTYYIGFYAYSDMDMFYIALDDILIDIHQGISSANPANINIFPNPANEFLQVTSGEEISRIEIHSALGQMVFSSVINGRNQSIDVSSFANGMYFMKIVTIDGTYSKPIQINR